MSAQPPNTNQKRNADVADLPLSDQPKKLPRITNDINITGELKSNKVTGGSSFEGFSEYPTVDQIEKLGKRAGFEIENKIKAKDVGFNDVIGGDRFG
jgi:hypothetical protein